MIMDIPVRHNFTIIGAFRRLCPLPTPVPKISENSCRRNEDATAVRNSSVKESVVVVSTALQDQRADLKDENGSVSFNVSKTSSSCQISGTTKPLPRRRKPKTSEDDVDVGIACLISHLEQEASITQNISKDYKHLLQNVTNAPSAIKTAETIMEDAKVSISGMASRKLQISYSEKMVREGWTELEIIFKALSEAKQCSDELAEILKKKKCETANLSRSLEMARQGMNKGTIPTNSRVNTLVEKKTVDHGDALAFQMPTMVSEDPGFGCAAPLPIEKGEVIYADAETANHNRTMMKGDVNNNSIKTSQESVIDAPASIAEVASKQEKPVEEAKDRRQFLQRTGMNKQQHHDRPSIMWGASNLGNKGVDHATSKLSVHDSFQALPSEMILRTESGDAAALHEDSPSYSMVELPGDSIKTSPLPETIKLESRQIGVVKPRDAVIPLGSEVGLGQFPTTADIILKGSLIAFWVLIGHFMLYKVSLTAA